MYELLLQSALDKAKFAIDKNWKNLKSLEKQYEKLSKYISDDENIKADLTNTKIHLLNRILELRDEMMREALQSI